MKQHESAATGGIRLWGGVLVALAMFAYSWFGDHREHPADDAGITLRYAERIARGSGFDYNDDEAVDGASNPVQTLVEAALLRAGVAPETMILLVASVCFALAAGVLFATFARFHSGGAAVFAVVALVAFHQPFDCVVDGMETPFVMLLAALLFRALHDPGEIYSGVVLGCLVANKLDGALAAIAFAAVFVASRRRFPWRATAVALLTAAPVFLLLLATFGSIVPNSMVVKMSVHARGWHMDPLWMHQLLLGGLPLLYLGAWASILWLPLSRELSRSFPIAVVQAWFVLYMLAYSTVNLGGPYPWYASTPFLLSLILATFLVHVLAAARIDRSPWPRLRWDPADLPRRTWPVALAVALGLGWAQARNIFGRLRSGHTDGAFPVYRSGDLARQSAGAWLRKNTSGTELFATFEGLPSYEYEGPVYDYSLLNSKRDERRFRQAPYHLIGPLGVEAEPPAMDMDRKLAATFRYDARVGPYALYARPDSEIGVKGVRQLVFPTPALWSGRPEAESPRTRAAQHENSWDLPVPGHAFFTVRAPEPPTLLCTPRLVAPAVPAAGPWSPVRLVIAVDGLELESTEIAPDQIHAPVRLTARGGAGSDEYTFEIDCRSLVPDDPGPPLVELAEVLVRCGEPLQPADFKLVFERDRQRIEHVATAGLPCAWSGHPTR